MPSIFSKQTVEEALKRQPRLDRLIVQLLGSDDAQNLLAADEEKRRPKEETD